MTQRKVNSIPRHGPDNAEHELRKAYNCVIEAGVSHFWDRRAIPGVSADEVVTVYKRAIHCYNDGHRLAAERWARTAKHLARAFWHEAKIAFLEPRVSDLPFLEGFQDEELSLHETAQGTQDLLNCVGQTIPSGSDEVFEKMKRYLSRGQRHLTCLNSASRSHELLAAERIKAAHEYGRVLECMTLAYEAETSEKTAA